MKEMTIKIWKKCFRLPEEGEAHQLHTAAHLYSVLVKRFPKIMQGMNANQFGKTLIALGAERVHTAQGNVYRVVPVLKLHLSSAILITNCT